MIMNKHFFFLLTVSVASLALSGCSVDLPQPEKWQPVQMERTQEERVAIAEKEKGARAREAQKLVQQRQYALIRPEEQNCKSDDDCRLATVHCCSCERGGALAAMRKDQFSSIIKRRVRGCEGNACPQMVSRHPSCQAKRAICKDEKCVVDRPADSGAKKDKNNGIGVEKIKGDAKSGSAEK